MSGGRIPRAFIDDLLARVDIVELVDSHVPLKKTGANYVARCPFHTEKTPSFSVNSNKQFFHCFGCGASGNAITFLMEFNHLDFVEAVEDLAAFIGIAVPREAGVADFVGVDKVDLQNLYDLMAQVADFYVQQLRASEVGKQAVAYFKKRDIGNEVAKAFMLGYAPQDWQMLTRQFSKQALIDTGLLGQNDDGQVYARFRNRVMFPIRDKRGRVVGFGGRVLDETLPKYLNSPETPLFYKGREVYGLYDLLKKNAKPQRILVVEGYMDVIALAQFGISYAVATLGTATSQAHLELLFRYTSELVFCFDGDNAGRAAIWKAIEAAFPVLRDGRQIRILLLSQGHDPDSFIRKQGFDSFLDLIEKSCVLSDYFFASLIEEFNVKETEGRAQLNSKANSYLAKLPDSIYSELMQARLQELSGVNRLGVQKSLPRDLASRRSAIGQQQKNSRPPLERQTLAMLIQNPSLIEVLEEKNIDWSVLAFKGVEKFRAILSLILKVKPSTTGVLLECFRDHPDAIIIRQLAVMKLDVPVSGVEQEFNGALDKLLEQGMDTRFNHLLGKLENGTANEQEKNEFKKLSMYRK